MKGGQNVASVIVPVYNRARLLRETLDSVSAQTYRPIEIIVVDDGSTDDSADVARRWFDGLSAAEREMLELRIRSQTNQGLAAARNSGFRESIGEFIQFVDSDDLLGNQKLETQIGILASRPDVGFVYSQARVFREMIPVGEGPIKGSEHSQTLNGHICGVPLDSLFGVYRRSVLESVGTWREDCWVWIDREFNLRVLLSTCIVYKPAVLAYYRVHTSARISDRFPSRDVVETLKMMEGALSERADEDDQAIGREALAAQYFSVALHAGFLSRWALASESIEQGLRVTKEGRRRRRLWVLKSLLSRWVPNQVRTVIFYAIQALVALQRKIRRNRVDETLIGRDSRKMRP